MDQTPRIYLILLVIVAGLCGALMTDAVGHAASRPLPLVRTGKLTAFGKDSAFEIDNCGRSPCPILDTDTWSEAQVVLYGRLNGDKKADQRWLEDADRHWVRVTFEVLP